MHKQHPQTAYRKYAVSIGTLFENCDKDAIDAIFTPLVYTQPPVCVNRLWPQAADREQISQLEPVPGSQERSAPNYIRFSASKNCIQRTKSVFFGQIFIFLLLS